MSNRVVITGLGVVAPNGINLPTFTNALKNGISGLHYIPQLEAWKMGCFVAGYPKDFDDAVLTPYLSASALRNIKSTSIKYAIAAAMEAWQHAGLLPHEEVSEDTGCIFGNSICDVNHMRYATSMLEDLKGQQLGVRHIEQLMASGSSSYIAGLLGLGNTVFANSSACSTGTESILLAYEHIKNGKAKRMVAGSSEASSAYMWSVFDAMRVTNRNYNQDPTKASRPMHADSAGFIPGSGAGALILEDRETAIQRGATIYAEIMGGNTNSGGQRNGGSMTAPSSAGVVKCIQNAIKDAKIDANNIDLICGHLTGTFADKIEIENWTIALERSGANFPFINTLKSLTGHCISAAGSIESIAAIVQMHHSFIQPNINCESLQPEILNLISADKIVRQHINTTINTVIKANFGFGDVNSCIIFSKLQP